MRKVLIITRDKLISTRQLPNRGNVSLDGRFQFFINDAAVTPDIVVVFGKGLRRTTTFNVSRSRTILVTGEPYSVLAYPKGYCRQFGTVCSCQPQIKGDNVIYTPAILPWFVGAAFKDNGEVDFTLDYDALNTLQPKKEKLISVITSDKAFTRGHADRIRFVNRLVEKYGDKVDVYGHGFRPFDDKWSVLAPYKYHIVIENSTTDYYWTEKLSDCFLAGTYPLYHGCSNIADYYPADSLTAIDIRDFSSASRTIERTISGGVFEQRQAAIEQGRRLTLDKFNIFSMLAEVCQSLPDEATRAQTALQPAANFFSLHNLYLYTIGRTYCKLTSPKPLYKI